MPQRDYILRLIEQIGAALVALRKRILGGQVDPLTLDTELAALAGRAGFDLDLLRTLTGETLVMLVSPTGEVEPSRCWLMAELLFLDGLQALETGRPDEGATSLEKALLLYRFIEPGGGMLVGFPEAGERAAEIEALLGS